MQLDAESESTFATMDVYEREAQLVIDYSSLMAELVVRHQPSLLPHFSLSRAYMVHVWYTVYADDPSPQSLEAEEEVEAYVERLKESLSSIEGVLHRTTAPNLKALEKMGELKVKLQGVTEGILMEGSSIVCI